MNVPQTERNVTFTQGRNQGTMTENTTNLNLITNKFVNCRITK